MIYSHCFFTLAPQKNTLIMKKHLLFILILILKINCYAQIKFEKGYFINNSGERIECLIQNLDWKNNPSKFLYKTKGSSLEKENSISTTKEFGVYNISKYIRAKIDIDRSNNSINNLTNERRPIFKTETLFLKVLVEGQNNLYSYAKKNLNRFFYSAKNNTSIKQLIYKKFKFRNNKIGKNNRYKQQLIEVINCENISSKTVENIKYKKNL